MKIKRDKNGLALVREHTERLDLAALADEKDRIQEQLNALQERLSEIDRILATAKNVTKVGDEVEVK